MTPCIHAHRQHRAAVLEAVAAIVDARSPFDLALFREIQARTGIAPVELAPIIEELVADCLLLRVRTGYRPGSGVLV